MQALSYSPLLSPDVPVRVGARALTTKHHRGLKIGLSTGDSERTARSYSINRRRSSLVPCSILVDLEAFLRSTHQDRNTFMQLAREALSITLQPVVMPLNFYFVHPHDRHLQQ